jgi:serine/threonine protein kinase
MMPNSIYMDRFLIKAHLGRGGFADVYLAQDRTNKDGGDVALKLFQLNQQATATRAAIEQELDVAQFVQSEQIPGLVPYLETCLLPGKFGACIVQRYIPSQTLHDILIERPQLSMSEALPIAIDLCDTLGHLHRRGIAHCDVKPANILMPYGRSESPYLADLGSGRFFGDLTSVDYTAVSMRYSAPELFYTNFCVDGRLDVYSLAVTLLDIVQGLPESEHHKTYYDCRTMIRSGSRPENRREIIDTLSKVRDKNLRMALEPALADDCKHRYDDITKFQQELTALLPNDQSTNSP